MGIGKTFVQMIQARQQVNLLLLLFCLTFVTATNLGPVRWVSGPSGHVPDVQVL